MSGVGNPITLSADLYRMPQALGGHSVVILPQHPAIDAFRQAGL
ncbi:hypothetical protein O0544_23140 [Edwardsiella anguillarum]|nr:hypothetical protein [Edwardsiella anguillarum]